MSNVRSVTRQPAEGSSRTAALPEFPFREACSDVSGTILHRDPATTVAEPERHFDLPLG